ncbi:MAG: lipopolysaccharide biosynthesis protein [Acidobacteriota bacterium]
MRSLLRVSINSIRSLGSASNAQHPQQGGDRRRIFASIGMIASANIVSTALAVLGSLVQAHFIVPDDLGFVRKYSIVSGYAIFLSFGLFNILQREYPVLIGRGETEKARRAAAIGQTWCLLASAAVCGVLAVLSVIEFIQGRWREGCALFIQIVSVWSILYGGYLITTFRSGQEFVRLAKGSFLSSLTGILVLPLFALWPFSALVLRSVAGTAVQSAYLHAVRPVRVGFILPAREFFTLVKRGMRLFVGTYIRYNFWLTVELWLMLWIAGDTGVGLFVFSLMIVEAAIQLSTAINQVYIPRMAQKYGETGSLSACLRLAYKPTLLNTAIALVITGAAWFIMPLLIGRFFPNYLGAVPLVRVLLFDTIIVGLSLPMFMVQVLEDYATQTAAALIGLGVFAGTAVLLHSAGLREMSVVWGTIAGRFSFVGISLLSLAFNPGRKEIAAIPETAS